MSMTSHAPADDDILVAEGLMASSSRPMRRESGAEAGLGE